MLPSTTQQPDLYLDLLKNALNGALWGEEFYVPEPWAERDTLKRRLFWKVAELARRRGIVIARTRPLDLDIREEGKNWPLLAHTMIGRKRLDNLQWCVETVLADGVAGDLIETGVWRGGATILMRGVLKAHGDTSRTVWVADSFEGLPAPSGQYAADDGDVHHTWDRLRVSREEVAANFERYGLLDDRVRFLKGWFRDTLPTAPISELAVLRVDGDMYESTMDALTALYPKVSVGGFVIVDDFCIASCTKAVEDFRAANGIVDPITMVDYTGGWWRRET